MGMTGVCSFTEVFFLTLDISAKFAILFAGLEAVGCQASKRKDEGF